MKPITFLCLLLALVGCATLPLTPATGDNPTAATPPAASPETLPSRAGVRVRLHNFSPFDFEEVVFRFPNEEAETLEVAALPSGAISEGYFFPQGYSSAYVEVTADGKRYTAEPVDYPNFEETPITSGSYIFTLTLENGILSPNLDIDRTSQSATVAPVIEQLQRGGATVVYEASVQRGTFFDVLWGRKISTAEYLNVNDQRVVVYLFDDVATAQEAAATVQYGGTTLIYNKPDGSVAQEWLQVGLSHIPVWWQWDRYLILLGDMNPPDAPTAEVISAALGVAPLHSSIDDAAVQVRLASLSDLTFNSIRVAFPNQTLEYGALSSGQQSAYQGVTLAYRYATIRAEAEGRVYEWVAIDYMGETPLTAGHYTYVLDVVPNTRQLRLTYLRDDEIIRDPNLEGQWYWRGIKQTDGNFSTAPLFEEASPSITLTTESNYNTTGLNFSLYVGCNYIGGAYLPTPEQSLILTYFESTAMLCEEPIMDAEERLMEALPGILYYSIEGDTLTLTNAIGEQLRFSRHDPQATIKGADN